MEDDTNKNDVNDNQVSSGKKIPIDWWDAQNNNFDITTLNISCNQMNY